MSGLDEIRANQHMDVKLAADHQLEAFLEEAVFDTARLDLIPHSDVEIRHLAHVRPAA